MKIALLIVLFLGAFAVHGLVQEEDESKELDADFEEQDANGENEVDAEAADKAAEEADDDEFEVAAETDADAIPGPGLCTGCTICNKLAEKKKLLKKLNPKQRRLYKIMCGRCKFCNPKYYLKLTKRLIRKIPFRKIPFRRITNWGRRRRSWSRRRRRRRRRRRISRRRRRRRRRRRW